MGLHRAKPIGTCAAVLLIASVFALAGSAQAQDYPNKTVTFITPAAAGNSPDVVTRVVADKLSQMWKQQVVVFNRPGSQHRGDRLLADGVRPVVRQDVGRKGGRSADRRLFALFGAGFDLHRSADHA